MATSTGEANDGSAFYGALFIKAKPIPVPTPVLDALLRAIALHIGHEVGDTAETYLTPAKLAAFYQGAGYDFDSFFVEMPHASISTVYQGLGCQHSLLPSGDDFAAPSIPALTVKGFVRWQAIQTLLGPQAHVPVLRFAVANWGLKHPDTDIPFPLDLPKEAFPAETDADTDRWHQECADRCRMKLGEEGPSEPPKEAHKTGFADRRVPYTHVRVSPTTPRDYFAARPVNVSYVHVASPRPTPPGPSPERERAREREHYMRRQTPSSNGHTHRRRSFSDYPHSPHETRPVRVPHLAPERSSPRRRYSQPQHYSSTSESDGPSISPRGTSRPKHHANEPSPISVRRAYTGSSEDSPRVIRTSMPPPPIPPSHMHSPRPSDLGRGAARDDESKRRSTLFDLKEKISSFIGPAVAGSRERPRSASGSRGRPDGLRRSREDIPGSRLSRPWSDDEMGNADSEDDRKRRSRRHSHDDREHHREKEREKERNRERERERERQRERERERAARERARDRDLDRDRDRDRERSRDRPRDRDRPHSDSDRDRRRRDRDRDRDRDLPVQSPPAAAAAAAAALHRDRRRGDSDEDLSPRRWARGPYLAGGGVDGWPRRTSSHPDIDRWREWDRERDRERNSRDREERNCEREHGRDRDRWRMEDRPSRERDRDREKDSDRDHDRDRGRGRGRGRDRDRERMPSPAMPGVTGVGGRKYPDIPWPRD